LVLARWTGSSAGHAEDVEEIVPERLCLGAFCLSAFPVKGESKGAVFDLIEG